MLKLKRTFSALDLLTVFSTVFSTVVHKKAPTRSLRYYKSGLNAKCLKFSNVNNELIRFCHFRYTEKKAKSKKKKKKKDDESPKAKSSNSSSSVKDKLPTASSCGSSSLEKVKNAAFDRLRNDAGTSSGTYKKFIN